MKWDDEHLIWAPIRPVPSVEILLGMITHIATIKDDRCYDRCYDIVLNSPDGKQLIEQPDTVRLILEVYTKVLKLDGYNTPVIISYVSRVQAQFQDRYKRWWSGVKQMAEGRQTALCTREELTAIVWHPSHMQRLLDNATSDVDVDNIMRGFVFELTI